ncbi:hypothetical protein PENSPDRAFT_688187 [Peniophora sp. CONT]|nr:hypothetical protein PENSPDRAFT_688187 [Peniophora sp. CONT]
MFNALAYVQHSEDAWDKIVRARFSTHVDASCFRGGLSRADRLYMLELELKTMRTSYTVAQRYRNAAVTSCCLPFEVLANIFSFAQDIWEPRYGRVRVVGHNPTTNDPLVYHLGWITVTHVCSRWRQAALSSPYLWRKLDCIHLNPQRAADYLLLSGRLPLDLTLSENYLIYQATSNTSIAARNWLSKSTLERTERLDIQFERERFEPWASCLELAAPALKELRIHVIGALDEPLLLDRRIFASQCPPHLTRLHLEGCFLRWNSPLFSVNLTHLTLAAFGHSELRGLNPTTVQLQELLSRMPLLQELSLDGILPLRPDRTDVEPLRLPPPFKRLRVTMQLRETYARYSNFWRHFTFSPFAIVIADICIYEFTRDDSDDSDAEDEDISAVFAPIFPEQDTFPQPRELTLGEEAMSVRYTSLSPLNEWVANVRTDMQVNSTGREDPVHGSRHLFVHANLPLYAEDWPLELVHTILISPDPMRRFKNMKVWLERFAHAASVQRLAVPYLDSLELLYALTERQNVIVEGSSFDLFPQLKEIVFVGDKDEKKMGAFHAPLDVSLLDLLDRRREAGVPILHLMVDNAIWMWDVWNRVIARGTSVEYFNLDDARG